jgi:hypothetical protein
MGTPQNGASRRLCERRRPSRKKREKRLYINNGKTDVGAKQTNAAANAKKAEKTSVERVEPFAVFILSARQTFVNGKIVGKTPEQKILKTKVETEGRGRRRGIRRRTALQRLRKTKRMGGLR